MTTIPDVTKNDPSGCFKRALHDEPVFTLLARDPQAPALVRSWASQREAAGQPEQVLDGGTWVTPPHPDAETIAHARYCAARMEVWRYENQGDEATGILPTWRRFVPGEEPTPPAPKAKPTQEEA